MVFPVNHSNDIEDSNHPIAIHSHPLPQLPSSSGHLSKTTTLWRTRAKTPGGIIPRTDKTGVINSIIYIYNIIYIYSTIYIVLYNIDVYMMIYMIYDYIYYIYVHVLYVIMCVFIYASSSSHLCIKLY